MSLLIDLLTGKLFSFKTAAGTDVNAGTSQKLLVTPKSIKDSYLGTLDIQEPFATLQFGMDAQISSGATSFTAGTQFDMTPDTGNGYFLTGRSNSFTATLFVWAKVDSGVVGEVCVMDATTNSPVTSSNFTFNNTAFQHLKSGTFTLAAGKVYTYGLRRVSGGLLANAYLRAAMVTMKIPKL